MARDTESYPCRSTYDPTIHISTFFLLNFLFQKVFLAVLNYSFLLVSTINEIDEIVLKIKF